MDRMATTALTKIRRRSSPEMVEIRTSSSGMGVLVVPVALGLGGVEGKARRNTAVKMEIRTSSNSSRSGGETQPEAQLLRRPSVELESEVWLRGKFK